MRWDDELSPGKRRTWEAFVRHVRESTVRAMAESAFVMSLAPDGEPDVKLAVETGFAVLLDKPIVVVAVGGRQVPPGLRRVAHAVIEVEDMDTEAGERELRGKLEPVLREFGVEGRP